MLGWALLFFLLALSSGALGLLAAGVMANLAHLLFCVFVVLLMSVERYLAHRR